MKKINLLLLSLHIEFLWKRADLLKAVMYSHPSPEKFRRCAHRYHCILKKIDRLENIYLLRQEIPGQWKVNQSTLILAPSMNSQSA